MNKNLHLLEQDEFVMGLNSELLNQKVYITTLGGWYGIVIKVLDTETFLVESEGGREIKVDMHHIRSISY